MSLVAMAAAADRPSVLAADLDLAASAAAVVLVSPLAQAPFSEAAVVRISSYTGRARSGRWCSCRAFNIPSRGFSRKMHIIPGNRPANDIFQVTAFPYAMSLPGITHHLCFH